MATRSKRGSQTAAQKRKRKEDKRKKRKAKTETHAGSASAIMARRQMAQMQQLVPTAGDSENSWDVALFDDAVLAQLDDSEPVLAVRAALQLLAVGQFEDAETALGQLPRKSPMSDWKLLVRGIRYWYANDHMAAQSAWSKLDKTRRSARIATALVLAHCDNLSASKVDTESDATTERKASTVEKAISVQAAHVSETNPAAQSKDGSSGEPLVAVDKTLLAAAKVVRRVRIDRPAIKYARQIMQQNLGPAELNIELTVSPEQLDFLKEFSTSFRSTELALVRGLELTALERASWQPYIDIFQTATKRIRGLPHDPNNFLRSWYYSMGSSASINKTRALLQKYLNIDLPGNKLISASLRQAIGSTLLYREASVGALLFDSRDLSELGLSAGGKLEAIVERVRDGFIRAIHTYPAHRQVHIAYTEWLQKRVDNALGDKVQLKLLRGELYEAMTLWAQSLEKDFLPRQYLAETLLKEGQLAEAETHIDWLMLSRPDDPRIKALPWKRSLLECMQLSRRAANLPQLKQRLPEVLAQWPAWLSASWKPYFNASLLLRAGAMDEYRKCRESILAASDTETDDLADACMMLAAAQKMAVPADAVKPLREVVRQLVSNISTIATDQLIATGAFFRSLQKIGLDYPAYRMHGSKIGRELLHRIDLQQQLVATQCNTSEFIDAITWMSDYRFWLNRSQFWLPSSLEALVEEHVGITAVYVNFLGSTSLPFSSQEMFDAVDLLHDAAVKEADPFNRYWYEELVESVTNKLQFVSNLDRWGSQDDYGIDTDCPCPACQAQKQEADERQAQHRNSEQSAQKSAKQRRQKAQQLEQLFEQAELF